MKHSRNWRQKKADALLQEWVKRNNPKCLLCGNPTQVAHHFFPKSVSNRLRYELANCVPLCNGCHNRLHQSGDPSYEQRIIEIKGKKWYQRLLKLKRELVKTNVAYYQAAIAKLSTF